MGVVGEVKDEKVLRLRELACVNRRFAHMQSNGSCVTLFCVRCGCSVEVGKGEWCNTCWASLKLEAGYGI